MGMVYFIEQLITTYGIDPALTRIANSYEFDLIPVMNIDGTSLMRCLEMPSATTDVACAGIGSS